MVKFAAVALIALASLLPTHAQAGCSGGSCRAPVRSAFRLVVSHGGPVRGLFGRVRENRPVRSFLFGRCR